MKSICHICGKSYIDDICGCASRQVVGETCDECVKKALKMLEELVEMSME